MSSMNAFVHDLNNCTKLQLFIRCIVSQTRHQNFRVGKVLGCTGICTIVNQICTLL